MPALWPHVMPFPHFGLSYPGPEMAGGLTEREEMRKPFNHPFTYFELYCNNTPYTLT